MNDLTELTIKETAPTSGVPSDNPDFSDRARGTASEATVAKVSSRSNDALSLALASAR